MRDEDGHADGRGRDPQVREMEDLAALGDELPFLLRVAVVKEDVDLGQRVERDRVGIDAGLLGLAATWARIWPSNSAIASPPVPETAW
jgi:hypothetical protein